MTKEELRKSLDFVNEERERLQRELERKDNIIKEIKKASDEIFHKYPYERKKWFDKIKELEENK